MLNGALRNSRKNPEDRRTNAAEMTFAVAISHNVIFSRILRR